MALVIWSLTTLTAPIAGPLLGGYISDNYVWPWIFLINVPVGILCGFICWTNLKNQETTDPQDSHRPRRTHVVGGMGGHAADLVD